jgi:hypothetical protein
MGIREPAMALRGQAPETLWAADFAGLVVKGDEILGIQFGKVLTDANGGDPEGAREGAGRQRTARLKRMEEPALLSDGMFATYLETDCFLNGIIKQ